MTGDKQHDATTELNEALAAGFAAGNFDALGPFYTEDASLLPPRGKILEGRPAVSAFWAGVANRFNAVAFTTVALKDLGEAARRETGTYVMGGEGQPAEGKYVFVWQLVDGEWQIESAIWNRNGEAGGARRQGQGQGQGQGQARARGSAARAVGRAPGRAEDTGAADRAREAIDRAAAGRRSRAAGAGPPAAGRPGAARQGGQGGGYGAGGGGSLYDGNAGLYSNPKE